MPFPRAIQNAPTLGLGLQLYYTAYLELDSTRAVGFSVGPIPWTAIKDYVVAHEFSEDQIEDAFYYIRALDNAYLKYQNDNSNG